MNTLKTFYTLDSKLLSYQVPIKIHFNSWFDGAYAGAPYTRIDVFRVDILHAATAGATARWQRWDAFEKGLLDSGYLRDLCYTNLRNKRVS